MNRQVWGQVGIVLLLAAVMALAVWPMHSKVLEPRRQRLLGNMLAPPDQLASASQYAFSVASGEHVGLVPGAPPLSMSDLPMNTLSLVLGGFRGPLVMYMWGQGESEKRQKIHFNIIDNHMKIALLLADYPRVWVYLCWDIGWNIGAQWNTQEMKYKWIRHAIDFLKVGARKHPNSVIILSQMGDIYNYKLGHSFESKNYRRWIERDEGRSVFLLAYEWYDKARKVSRQFGTKHTQFSTPVLNSHACHAVSDYARELTQKMYDAFLESDALATAGKKADAQKRFDEGREVLAKAVRAWDWAGREWDEQVTKYYSPVLPHQKFLDEARQNHRKLAQFLKDVTPDNATELLKKIDRPKLWG